MTEGMRYTNDREWWQEEHMMTRGRLHGMSKEIIGKGARRKEVMGKGGVAKGKR
jgi:hypothetical protein